jgi:hypothetical protein
MRIISVLKENIQAPKTQFLIIMIDCTEREKSYFLKEIASTIIQ